MEMKHLRTLAMEIFNTLNDINLNYMKEIFYLSPSLMKHTRCMTYLFIIVLIEQNVAII